MKLEKFHLVAHSFGGFVSTVYSIKYPQHVDKLILMSPAGYSRIPENFDKYKYVTKFQGFVR